KLLKRLNLLKKTPTMILAARTYYDGVTGIDDRVQVHFDGVPLPGYGWVFPISASVANIGVGYWPHGLSRYWMPTTARAAFDAFTQSDLISDMLSHSTPIEPVKGYPIRYDFTTAPTYGDNIILVGEAAGLVNPLTGEGVDFALESGKLAAEHLYRIFNSGEISPSSMQAYGRLLKNQYQKLFVFLSRIRALYLNPILLNRFISTAERLPEISNLLVNILLGHQDAAEGVSLRTVRKVILRI
ncbi:MAG: NAD(P)/FAD-dependent oxidoreductase, partial [Chloroflexota bacterium]